ncbi:unnamed protein product [Parnassius mnemosyne]|uniref:FLYWCH-type domain-containing protein n=1 Tax=Parnassius mnemosyne TaxID=213953 RepID=A0AAV1K9S7_9NEOP
MIPGRKHACLMFHGYTFKRYQLLANGQVRWRCSKWHSGCRVSVKTNTIDPRDGIVLIENLHNHERPKLIRNKITYLSTGKKYPLLVCNEYVYKRIRVNRHTGHIFWRCVMIHKGCRAYCLASDDEIVCKNSHNHDAPKFRTSTGRWIMP